MSMFTKSALILLIAISTSSGQSNNIPQIFRDDEIEYTEAENDSYFAKVVRFLSEELDDSPTKCTTDDYCHQQLNSYYSCDQKTLVCVHKDLWPLTPIEWLGSVLFSIIMLLSNVGGIGGGGVAIPMVQIFFGWDLKKAIAISSFSIFVSTLTRFFFNWKERHPEKPNMGALDYGLSNVMMPLTLIGTQVGTFIYLMCPKVVINVLLTLLLIWLWIKATMKACDIVKKERAADAEAARAKNDQQNSLISDDQGAAGTNAVQRSTALTGTGPTGQDNTGKDEYGLPVLPTGDADKDQEILGLRSLIKQEKGHCIWKKQALNGVALAINMAMNVCRKTVFKKCTAADWITISSFVVVMGIALVLAVKMVSSEQSLKQKYGNVNLVKSDLVFNGPVLRMVQYLGFGGGFVAGALGLGGGVIFNPYLIGMGVPPKVSSATGMYLIMYSKVAAVTVYILEGKLNLQYGFWIAGWSSIGALFGLYGSGWYMDKYGKQSIIVISLAFILFLAVAGQPTYNFIIMAKEIRDGQDVTKFTSICEDK